MLSGTVAAWSRRDRAALRRHGTMAPLEPLEKCVRVYAKNREAADRQDCQLASSPARKYNGGVKRNEKVVEYTERTAQDTTTRTLDDSPARCRIQSPAAESSLESTRRSRRARGCVEAESQQKAKRSWARGGGRRRRCNATVSWWHCGGCAGASQRLPVSAS